jgi:thiopurine S-methyltransferase
MTFWHDRWKNQLTGWHRLEYNDLMVKHWPSLNAPDGGEVLVPLCGKSLDMLWLAEQGYSIVGMDMVEQAVQTFFTENQLSPESIQFGKLVKHSSPPFTIFQGDVFDLEAGTVQADVWYDRAAMIAIPPSTRESYVQQIRQQTKAGAVGLLITFTYPQHEMDGPPFSLTDEDVFTLFSNGFDVELLERMDLEDEKDRGLSCVTSSVFKITRK